MGAMLIIGMGPRNAGEDKTSPASSSEEKTMSEGMLKIPLSVFELGEGEDNATPESGDMVELEGTVEKIEGDVAMVRVKYAMIDENPGEKGTAPKMSEEDRMMDMAKKSDEESYS